MDDCTRAAVLEEVRADLERLWEELTGAADLDLERA